MTSPRAPPVARAEAALDREGPSAPKAVRRADYDAYYLGYSNGVLWPVFHYRLDLANFDTANIEAYRRVNQMFARQLAAQLRPDDTIWVHDYHLIPLGSELRALGCQQRIGFFLDIPLPPPLILAAIPGHDWLMRGLCSYDVVGLQSQADLEHFGRYIQREVHAQDLGEGRWRVFNRTLHADAFPIGIDVEEFRALGQGKEALEMAARMRRAAGQPLRRRGHGRGDPRGADHATGGAPHPPPGAA